MKILNSSDARREFGELLINAQHGPVGIKRNGNPVAVVISATEYAQLEALEEAQLKQSNEDGIADLQAQWLYQHCRCRKHHIIGDFPSNFGSLLNHLLLHKKLAHHLQDTLALWHAAVFIAVVELLRTTYW